MSRTLFFLLTFACVLSVNASWYWPFGGEKQPKPPRISELMEPASLIIDEAAEFAESGKVVEAVDAYKRALTELDRVEAENPERAQSPEFATLRNKRAYVNTAIDSLLHKQAQENAKAVAVTDTTELEKKYAKLLEERKAAKAPVKDVKEEAAKAEVAEVAEAIEKKTEETEAPAEQTAEVPAESPAAAPAKGAHADQIAALLKADPKSRKARLMRALDDFRAKDYSAAKLTIRELLAEKPNDASALNLRAAIESEEGDDRAAEKTLDQAITSNPRSHYAYYNMAKLFLRTRGAEGKDSARRYYQTGRGFGGPVNAELEEALK